MSRAFLLSNHRFYALLKPSERRQLAYTTARTPLPSTAETGTTPFMESSNHHSEMIKRSYSLVGKVTVTWSNSGSLTHKANLLKFLNACHEDTDLPCLKYNKHANNTKHAVTAAFEITSTMKGQAWSMVEKVLELYLHEVAKQGDWQWQQAAVHENHI